MYLILAVPLLLTLSLFVSVIVKAIGVYKYQKDAYRMLEHLEGPPLLWPWGNAKERSKNLNRINCMHMDYLGKYTSSDKVLYKLLGPMFFNGLAGGRNELVTADPVIVKHIMQDKFDIYTKSNYSGRSAKPFTDWLGMGIFTVDHGPHAPDGGKSWMLQRRIALNIFTRSLFKDYYQKVFIDHGNRLVEELEKKRGPNGENLIDLEFYMHAYTMDAFGMIAFGSHLGNLDGKDVGFGRAFDGAHTSFLKFIRKNIGWLLVRELLPDFLGTKAESLLEMCSPVHKELRDHIKALDDYTYSIIKQRKGQDETKNATDLLALFMQTTDDDGEPMFSDKMLRDMILSFMIAGRDTTAATLSWMWYQLGLEENKHVLQALLEEIDTVLGGEIPTYESLNDLPYLRGVIWETLRLHPIVPLTNAHSKAPDTLPDGTELPVGSRVTISSYAMGRDPRRYENPLVFDPNRWIPFTQPNQYEFPVFKSGRRICLGRDMALYEGSILAIQLLQNYVPELVSKNVTYGHKITMSVYDKDAKKDQLLVYLRSRKEKKQE